ERVRRHAVDLVAGHRGDDRDARGEPAQRPAELHGRVGARLAAGLEHGLGRSFLPRQVTDPVGTPGRPGAGGTLELLRSLGSLGTRGPALATGRGHASTLLR